MPPKKIRSLIHVLVANDIRDLPDNPTRLLALKTIKGIVQGQIHGAPLQDRRATGDLSDCRKVLFDTRKDIPPRFRIVFREVNDVPEILLIELLSVGDRFELEAYLNAALRLGRMDPKR